MIWAGIGLPSGAQDNHTGHGVTKHSGPTADEKAIDQITAGMSAAEKKFVRDHMATMSPDHRKMMMDHLMRMSPAERRRMVQQRMQGGGMHGGMSGHGGHDGHGNHGGGAGHGARPSGKPKLAIGDRVPDFTVRDTQGKTLRLSELRKQTKSGIISVTFWCTFCHSCRDVEVRLDQFARDNKGQAVVAAIDASAGETAAGVTAFAKRKGLSLPILMDAPGTAADVFGVYVTTTTVVIDGKGILRYRGQFMDRNQMHASDALKAVIAGIPVTRQETPQRG